MFNLLSEVWTWTYCHTDSKSAQMKKNKSCKMAVCFVFLYISLIQNWAPSYYRYSHGVRMMLNCIGTLISADYKDHQETDKIFSIYQHTFEWMYRRKWSNNQCLVETWTSSISSQLNFQFILHLFSDIPLQPNCRHVQYKNQGISSKIIDVVECNLHVVDLLIGKWTFHWPIGYPVAMARHSFLVGEIVN